MFGRLKRMRSVFFFFPDEKEEKTPRPVFRVSFRVVCVVKGPPHIVTVDLRRSCWHEISEQMDRDRTFGGV